MPRRGVSKAETVGLNRRRKEDAMKRLALAGLVAVAVGAVAGSALASSGTNDVVIYDSTPANVPGNIPSFGPEAYGFRSLGDRITFAKGPRKLSSVVVTLSSWACEQGSWNAKDCYSGPQSTFSQPITLTIWNAGHTEKLASSTQTFAVPYRPSASPECTGGDLGKWYQASTQRCFNGLASNVTFDFPDHTTLPNTVVYEISYDTSHYGPNPLNHAGPSDSLNIGFVSAPQAPSVGSTPDAAAWVDGVTNADFAGTPAVQFHAARLSKVG
jgi:hypothetical protein